VLGSAAIFGAGFLTGQANPPTTDRALDLRTFNRVEELIRERYPQPVSNEDLELGATKGLVSGTGDPYSVFLTKEESSDLTKALAGEVEGIGVEVGERDGAITIIAPIAGTPADRAGLKSGDVVIGVDGAPTAGQNLDAIVKKIRGKAGTSVKLDIKSPGQAAREVVVTREKIKVPSVALSYQDNVAVLVISRFGDDTKEGIEKAAADIAAKKPRGVVLDLRGNPGGYLQGAVDVTSVFLKEGIVVKEQFAKGKTEDERVTGNPQLPDIPLVVLVDKGSASASEITAGALLDSKRATLVGEKTFGKGSVQDLINVGGGTLKLTIAEWLTPNGTSISKQGITPQIVVSSENRDAQLKAAIAQVK
jgi:carboxyl-terminal processing protease